MGHDHSVLFVALAALQVHAWCVKVQLCESSLKVPAQAGSLELHVTPARWQGRPFAMGPNA